MKSLLQDAASRAVDYLRKLPSKSVFPNEHDLDNLEKFDIDLPKKGWQGEKILALFQKPIRI